jgi:hypothetical protein
MPDPTLRDPLEPRRGPRWGALALLLGFSVSGCFCDDEPVNPVPPPEEVIDFFDQNAASKVDILWVIDDSESMAQEQKKVSGGFTDFFGTLLDSDVDYHIGVITTDPSRNGRLRAYDGPAVTGCDGCRYLTKEVGCDDPAVDVAGLEDEEAENKLLDECQAQLVFRDLITAGIGGNPFEEGFAMAAAALGLDDIDEETGEPTGGIPTENEGFIRGDASLYIIYVSDEDEGEKQDGDPIRYYARLFEDFKGRGEELSVSTSAIVGWPLEEEYPVLSEVCDILQTTFDNNRTTDDPRAATVLEAMTGETSCEDRPDPGEDPVTRAETGSRYIELACRTGGVVTNLCDNDYSSALDALGANAAGLKRKFILSQFSTMNVGQNCSIFDGDDHRKDCDGNGSTDDEFDGPICVYAFPLGVDLPADSPKPLVPRSEVNGWTYEADTGSINFRGRFVPKPGTSVEVRYRLRTETEDRQWNCGAPE